MTIDTRSALHRPPSPSAAPAAARRFLPEVQGLRAVAVLLVLIYHVDHDLLPGGYVGVDVFFVISGFLITTLLLREARETGRVSLAGFYVRRIRRILPAAGLVLAVTGALSFVLLPSPRLLDTAMQLAASAFYVENLFLADQAVDYLAAETAASPVQHFWSLAVEEQFYLVWPLLFVGWAALPRRRRSTWWVLGGAAAVLAASVAYSVVLTPDSPQQAYFLPQTRMWELAVGGVLAVVLSRREVPAALRWVLGWAGLAAIGAAAWYYSDETAFPGWAAALPVLGAAAVIAAGHNGRFSSYELLSTAPARFVGDISYALYLWHWPLIVFTISMTDADTLTPLYGALVVVASFLLAWATKVAVEDPVRRFGLLRTGRSAAVFAVVSALAVGLIAAGQYARFEGLRSVRFDPVVHVGPSALATSEPEGSPEEPTYPSPVTAADDLPSVYGDGCQASVPEVALNPCVYGPEDADTTVAVVGDSHAAHWVPALQRLAHERGWRVHTFTKSSCGFTSATLWLSDKNRDYTECVEYNDAVVRELTGELRPDLVFTSSSTMADLSGAESKSQDRAEIAAGMASLWEPLEEAGSELVVIRDTPKSRPRLPECVARHTRAPGECANTQAEAFAEDDPQVIAAEETDADVTLVDLTDEFCVGGTCPPVIGNVLVYRDSHHLTATYSRLLAHSLAEAAGEVLRV
ncbi:acyltransferase family protein [Streptomonospora mangrovi]|uniref:acyltransferase family protein n=1 Tax=Streptomonospora mangrovi TaxID=2883123 RepID=UPI0022DE1BB4|nr:acyltransferase family protein [Streptomonospora mangrovi]